MKPAIISFFFFLVFSLYAQSQEEETSFYYSDSSKYDVKSYLLDLKMSHQSTIISGFTKITAVSEQDPLRIFFVELNAELTVTKVMLNNQNCIFSRNDKWLRVQFPEAISKSERFFCTIYYSGEVSKVTSMGGFRSEFMESLQNNVTYTLSEPFGSYLWFPCKQVLRDKADSIFINITTKEGIKVASNGILKNVIPNPDKKEVRYEWASYYPTAYYLIAVALTNFEEYSYFIKSYNQKDSFLFQNFYLPEPGDNNEVKEGIDQTVPLMHLYEKLLLPYPFRKEKYGHCQAPIGGGMENQTITMINSFSFGLIAHELAHSWFGDLVTCATWRDIWLNEGLTSYFEYLAYENLKPTEAPNWLAGAVIQAYTEPLRSIVIPDEELDNERRIFNYSLTYRKGAYMAHQLRKKLGNDALFFSFLREYLKKYSYSTATVEDFKHLAEEKLNLSLDRFFDSWYYGFGMPKIRVFWSYDNNKLNLQFQQSGTSEETSAFDVTFDLKVHFTNGTDTIIKVNPVFAEENMDFDFYKTVSQVEKLQDEALILSVNESSLLKYYAVKIFPNPAYDSLNVNFANAEKNRQIEIIAYNGLSFGIFQAKERKNIIKIDQLPKGMYLVKVIGKKKATNLKFVKN